MALFYSQNWTTKVNIPFDQPEELISKKARLNLHLRDAPDGRIYLNCSYIDIIPPDASEEFVTANTDDDDW